MKNWENTLDKIWSKINCKEISKPMKADTIL